MPMRPTRVRLTAAGNSAWVPINRMISAFGVALGVVFSSNKNLTCTVQYTTDELTGQPATISRSTTTATVKLTNHGLSTNDSVVISQGGSTFDGTWAVASVVDQNTFTFTVTDAGDTEAAGVSVIPLRVSNHPTLASLTADADGNFQFPPTAVRLNCSSYTAGYCDLNIVSAGK